MANCRSCGAEIWFVKTKKDKWLPVDADPGEVKEYVRETMKCHFDTCPDADKFRKKQ